MDNSDLLFFDAYEQFYKMTGNSKAFEAFCRDAFGQFAKDMARYIYVVRKNN